jgi:hypothetical protein
VSLARRSDKGDGRTFAAAPTRAAGAAAVRPSPCTRAGDAKIRSNDSGSILNRDSRVLLLQSRISDSVDSGFDGDSGSILNLRIDVRIDIRFGPESFLKTRLTSPNVDFEQNMSFLYYS